MTQISNIYNNIFHQDVEYKLIRNNQSPTATSIHADGSSIFESLNLETFNPFVYIISTRLT